jgi:hypothetical protein
MQQCFVECGISSREDKAVCGGNSWSTVTILLAEDAQRFNVYVILYGNEGVLSFVCEADCCIIVNKITNSTFNILFIFIHQWEIHMYVLLFHAVAHKCMIYTGFGVGGFYLRQQ